MSALLLILGLLTCVVFCGVTAGSIVYWNQQPPYNRESLEFASVLIFFAKIMCVAGVIACQALIFQLL